MPATVRAAHAPPQSCRHFAATPNERFEVRASVGSEGSANEASRSMPLSRTYGVTLNSEPPRSCSMFVDRRSASTVRNAIGR